MLTKRSPELKKVLSHLEAKTSNRAPNWLTVIVATHPTMKNLYLWLITHNCLLILTCSLNITTESDPHTSNSLWTPSNLSIWSWQVSLKITHTNRYTPVLYTQETNTNTNTIEFRGNPGLMRGAEILTAEKNMILCASSTKKEGRIMYAKYLKAFSSSRAYPRRT